MSARRRRPANNRMILVFDIAGKTTADGAKKSARSPVLSLFPRSVATTKTDGVTTSVTPAYSSVYFDVYGFH
jgi:hypothetical protein